MKAIKLMIGASATMLMSSAMAVPLSYSVTNIGNHGLTATMGAALNDYGHVVVNSGNASTGRAFTYANGAYSMLEYFGGIDRAYDINSSGQVTGSATDPTRSLGRQAYLHADGVTTSLGTLGGKTSKGTALNESGHVVGYADLAEQYVTHAFMYKDGAMQDLGTLGGKISRAYAVNAHGDVAGFSTDAAYNTRSFLYTNGAMQELEMFGGLDSWAQGINDNGIVVGYAFSGDDVRAYRHADGLAFDLGSLGGSSSAAFAVNNAGAIVGYSTLGSNQDAGFLWEGGKMYDLNALIGRDLGWTIRAGLDINSRGQILVDACHVDTGCNALLLTPNEVPEPSTPATLLAAALAMFGGLALRRTLGK